MGPDVVAVAVTIDQTRTDEPIRIGLAGLGFIGQTVGEEFHHHPDATVTAVCDLDDDLLAEIGDAFAVPTTAQYTDYATFVADASLDAVLVGTPHTLHHEQVVAALERGLDVYCDKPLATSVADARDIRARVDSSDQIVMVGYQRHLQAAFQYARERFSESPPTWVTASMTQGWLDYSRDTWRIDPELAGGGYLYDTGSHVLDGLLWTTGLEPARVFASMSFHDEDQRVDVRGHLDLEFRSGATGTVSLYGDAPTVREHLHCWDEDGAVYVEGTQWGARNVREIDADAGEYQPYVEPGLVQRRADAFLESVRERTPPPATVEDALRVTALTEAAYESSATGDWVEVSS